MSTPAPPSPGELQTSLKGIIELLGHRASPRISDFTRLATAVQRERHVAGKSDTAELTRSAAMWTILHLDAPLRGVMPAGTEQQLGRLIGIGSAMPPAQGPEAGLNKDFERAVHSYLTTLGQPRFIDLADFDGCHPARRTGPLARAFPATAAEPRHRHRGHYRGRRAADQPGSTEVCGGRHRLLGQCPRGARAPWA